MLTEGGAGEAALLRGVVWVQREKLFARWKERFCILTRDYLHCFKKGSTQLTECGPFLFKVCFMYFCQLLLIETCMPDHLSPPFLRSRCWSLPNPNRRAASDRLLCVRDRLSSCCLWCGGQADCCDEQGRAVIGIRVQREPPVSRLLVNPCSLGADWWT